LVATSNYAPSELYPQGQNRSSFLPTIALIEANLTVLNVDGGEDYRLRTLKPAEIFFVPDNDENEQKLSDLFKNMSGGVAAEAGISVIHGREIPHKAKSEQVIWFDFRALCFGPRSQADYLYLAEHYEIVFLSGLERLTPQEKAEARRLTWLIDVLYDYRVKLCATSKVGVDDIYVEGDFAQEFTRTASRMVEMQSEAYLKLPHLTLNAPKS
jgi:ATPase, AFG1 family